ncbi:hypothetical protein MIND_00976800 [Mycena indigotica]|uniref:DUF6534 domain-containing protein n=1 Tax=Mycena indigotica TaxID=2126181 RepID=A0A8H6SFJ2_9AGAR|nr:uncharacterized protein MIND_00976800 [Mycena indigotica]KAF7297432.1 hypothetical protein MIND_00976800 [Mycena indigotica]
MSAATLQVGFALDNTMGSMLLGVIISAVLYGISLLQCLFYFTRYMRDPAYLKTLVASTVFLDTIHLVFVVHTVSHHNIILTGLIIVIILATSGEFSVIIAFSILKNTACGTAWVVLALEAGTYQQLLNISPLTISINALSTSTDVIITSILCYMLYDTQPASLETETIVNRLILFTINTGL